MRFAKTADDDALTVPDQTATGYSITVTNEGAVPSALTSITDSLPAGFTYNPGSTTGLTTDDPVVSGQDVTWTGAFTVPAADPDPGTIPLHFEVTVPEVEGVFMNSVTGDGPGVSVIDARDRAPVEITVTSTEPTGEPTDSGEPTGEPSESVAPTSAEPLPIPSDGLSETGAETGPALTAGLILVIGGAVLPAVASVRRIRAGRAE